MRGRFAFPMQSTGRGIAAAPESARQAEQATPVRPRALESPRAHRPSGRQGVRPQYLASP